MFRWFCETQLFAYDVQIVGSLNPDTDGIRPDADNCDPHIVPDPNPFPLLAR
jgi:hypothetical protein